LRAAFGEALTLPMVYPDAAAVASARAGYDEGLARLEAEVPTLVRGRTFADVIDDLRWTNFLVAYQGEDDRNLQSRFATLMARAIDGVAPEWRASPRASATGARIRIGFASSFFSDGTCGRYFRSWIADLDRTRFEIILYNLRRDATPFLQQLSAHADRVRTYPGTALVPSAIAPAIRADALDVLVYPELGMNAPTFALAALRLAPIQCAAWGHPVTSGHATIDAFFTCAAMEPGDAAQHYAEKLVPLPGIGTNYERPAVPDGASRERFGLPEGVPLFLCPQSLFKIHPDTDALFARVLTAVPAARLVAFEGRHPALTAKYRARLAGAFGRAGLRDGDRLILLPQCGHDDYLRINAVCDAMLDTLRWSGGNTSLDALAAGLPVVTLPGRYMRGRQSAGMLSIAGLDDLIARDDDDYVRIASTLASDRAFQREVSARTRDAAAKLFGDSLPVRALEDALSRLVR
jgi:CRISPR-associated protein Csy1